MSELPDGWVVSTLAELADRGKYGWTTKAAPTGSVRFLRTTDITKGPINWESVPYCLTPPDDLTGYLIKARDILISRAGSVGFSVLIRDVPEPTVFASYLIRFEPSPAIEARYLAAFLRCPNYWAQVGAVSSGIALANVNAAKLAEVNVPLAPYAEQKRIAGKLEVLLGRVDGCRERLEAVGGILKRFRQSVLAAATSGRLTEDWREANGGGEEWKSLIKKDTFLMTETELPELPNSWKWVALGNYAHCFRGRFSPRPRNDPRYFKGNYAFIQIGDLPREGGLVSTHIQTLNEEGLAVSRKFLKGTVVIAIVGATIGNTGILAYDMCVTDSIIGLETGYAAGNHYVELFLRSQKDVIRKISYASGGQPNINLATLNPYPLALPPLLEQQEIVRRVETLFAVADRMEARLSEVRKSVERLTPAVLAKAFRGELVEQDPTDEPASVLLERLRAGAVDGTKGRRGTKKRG